MVTKSHKQNTLSLHVFPSYKLGHIHSVSNYNRAPLMCAHLTHTHTTPQNHRNLVSVYNRDTKSLSTAHVQQAPNVPITQPGNADTQLFCSFLLHSLTTQRTCTHGFSPRHISAGMESPRSSRRPSRRLPFSAPLSPVHPQTHGEAHTHEPQILSVSVFPSNLNTPARGISPSPLFVSSPPLSHTHTLHTSVRAHTPHKHTRSCSALGHSPCGRQAGDKGRPGSRRRAQDTAEPLAGLRPPPKRVPASS